MTIKEGTPYRVAGWDARSLDGVISEKNNMKIFGTKEYNGKMYYLIDKEDYEGDMHYMIETKYIDTENQTPWLL